MSALQSNPEVAISAPDEDLGPSTYWRGNPRVPWHLAWRQDFPEATQPVPEVLVVTQEESGLACLHTRRDPTPLWKLHRNPKIHVSTGEKSYVPTSKVTEAIGPCTDWRGIPRGPSQLAWRLDFPEET